MFPATVYRVMIASPGDVLDERKEVQEVIHQWNSENSTATGIVILPVTWESNTTPEMGERPQSIINRQILDESDILVGVFWTKLGTPSGASPSGTVEEITRFIHVGKRVMLYFSRKPVNPYTLNEKQLAALKEFKVACFQNGLVQEYDSLPQLRDMLSRHLTSIARELAKRDSNAVSLEQTTGDKSGTTDELVPFPWGIGRERQLRRRVERIAKLSGWSRTGIRSLKLVRKTWATGYVRLDETEFILYVPKDEDYPNELMFICIPSLVDWRNYFSDMRVIMHDCEGFTEKVKFILVGDQVSTELKEDMAQHFSKVLSAVPEGERARFSLLTWDETALRFYESSLGLG